MAESTQDIEPEMDVLAGAEYVAQHAEHVRIRQEGVNAFADVLLDKMVRRGYDPFRAWASNEFHPQTMDEEALEHIFVLDTLNFCFWTPDMYDSPNHWTVEFHGKLYRGYYALCAAIARALEERIPITSPRYYRNLSIQDAMYIFRGATHAEVPMLAQRVSVLHEAGDVLVRKFGGRFRKCIEAAECSAQALIRLVASNFDSYNDIARYKGKTVRVYKRAQILVADLWSRFGGRGFGRFDDIDSLTMFADYRVPQALAYLRVLEYDDALLARMPQPPADVDAAVAGAATLPIAAPCVPLLQNGEAMEVELRCCSIAAVERIRQRIIEKLEPVPEDVPQRDQQSARPIINSVVIDFYLWDHAQHEKAAMARTPFHRTRCVFY